MTLNEQARRRSEAQAAFRDAAKAFERTPSAANFRAMERAALAWQDYVSEERAEYDRTRKAWLDQQGHQTA